jgi:ATP synthase protein I
MNDGQDEAKTSNAESAFSRQVGAQAARKLKARREATKSVWFGLGMSGLIGWSVTVPALLGAALGIWIDERYKSTYSWTLMLLLMGLIIGCMNAWHWVHSQYKEMQEDDDE